MELIILLILAAGLGVSGAAGWWAVRKARRTLGHARGRETRRGEELSYNAWMDVPVEQIDAAVRELRQNPFDPTDHNPHLNVDILSAAEEPINLTRREEEQSQEDQARAYVTSAELSSGYSHNTVEIRFPGGGK